MTYVLRTPLVRALLRLCYLLLLQGTGLYFPQLLVSSPPADRQGPLHPVQMGGAGTASAA